jgi:hypothetical protein
MVTGCGEKTARTYPVKGRLELPATTVNALAGHTLEIALNADNRIRAAGEIQADGSFELKTVQDGRVLEGSVPGEYVARIVLNDDDAQKRAAAAKAIHSRYLRFEKSGLVLTVPSEQPIAFKVLR